MGVLQSVVDLMIRGGGGYGLGLRLSWSLACCPMDAFERALEQKGCGFLLGH